MSLCERLSDRMPAVAGGQEWTADEREHLDRCAECLAEWELVQAARGLGEDVSAGLSAHHVTERVLGRLRVERADARVRRRGLGLVALAAAAALALMVWSPNAGAPARGALDVASAALAIPELDSLRAPELEALLRTMDSGSDDPANDLVPLLPAELEAGELEGVLGGLEG